MKLKRQLPDAGSRHRMTAVYPDECDSGDRRHLAVACLATPPPGGCNRQAGSGRYRWSLPPHARLQLLTH